MKQTGSFILLTVLLCAFAHAENEIVFVNLKEVFKLFYKTQMVQDQIRQQADDAKFEREIMQKDVEAMRAEIEVIRADSRDEMLSADVRQSKRNLLEEKLVAMQKAEQDIFDFEKLRKEQLGEQNTRMTRKLFDEIQGAVVKYGKMKSYAAILDRSGQSRVGTDLNLYTSAGNDVTAEILQILNEGHEDMLNPDQSADLKETES